MWELCCHKLSLSQQKNCQFMLVPGGALGLG